MPTACAASSARACTARTRSFSTSASVFSARFTPMSRLARASWGTNSMDT